MFNDPKGYYSLGTVVTNGVIVNLADDQVPCPAGTYQGDIDQSSCDNASAGHYSLGTYTHNGVTFPATEETACVAGTYQPNTGQSSCIDADAGYYAHSGTGSGNGTVNQQPCAVGTWQNQTGQSECILAESGYYSLGTTTMNGAVTNLANQQVACGSGYYSLYQESTPEAHVMHVMLLKRDTTLTERLLSMELLLLLLHKYHVLLEPIKQTKPNHHVQLLALDSMLMVLKVDSMLLPQ